MKIQEVYNNYEINVQQVALFQKYGPLGIKIVGKDFIQRNWLDRIYVCVRVFMSIIFKGLRIDLNPCIDLLKHKIQAINEVNSKMTMSSSCLKTYFNSAQIFRSWNKPPQGFQNWLLNKTDVKWNAIHKQLHIKYKSALPAENVSLFDSNVSCSYLNSQKLPLALSSTSKKQTMEEAVEWLKENRDKVKKQLSDHGAVLLRGFPVNNAKEFTTVVETILEKKPNDYRGGEGSRDKVEEGVYTSTKAPKNFTIPLHHELSCTRKPPAHICFYCDIAPEPGTGQTTLGSTEKISNALKDKPELWYAFKGKTIKYISRHPPKGHFLTKINPTHKAWQEVFETNDKKEVERICKRKKFDFKWDGEWIQITREGPGTRADSKGTSYWHNQAHLYHANPRLRGGWVNHILANMVYCRPSTRNYDVEFQDGKQMSKQEMYQIYDVLEDNTAKFDWQKGDVLIVDNKSSKGAMHGRAAYESDRRILAALVD